MERKTHFIIVLRDNHAPKFVNKIDNHPRMCMWEEGKTALPLSKSTAEAFAEALQINGFPAYVIEAPQGTIFRNPIKEEQAK